MWTNRIRREESSWERSTEQMAVTWWNHRLAQGGTRRPPLRYSQAYLRETKEVIRKGIRNVSFICKTGPFEEACHVGTTCWYSEITGYIKHSDVNSPRFTLLTKIFQNQLKNTLLFFFLKDMVIKKTRKIIKLDLFSGYHLLFWLWTQFWTLKTASNHYETVRLPEPSDAAKYLRWFTAWEPGPSGGLTFPLGTVCVPVGTEQFHYYMVVTYS